MVHGNPSGFVNCCSWKLDAYHPTEAEKQGPYLQVSLEQIVNSFCSLEFSQADTLKVGRVAGVLLGCDLERLEAVLVFVCSNIYRSRLRPSQEVGSKRNCQGENLSVERETREKINKIHKEC